MSGLNKFKNRTKRWRKSFYLISLTYLVIVIVLAAVIYNIPQLYAALDRHRVDDVKQELMTALDQTSESLVVADLTAITANTVSEIVVQNNGKVIYSTMDTVDFLNLDNLLSEDALSYQSVFEYVDGENHYQVWIAIYKMNPQVFFEVIMGIIIVTIIILCIIISILVLIIFRKLITPLRRLQKNILNMKAYRFSELDGSSNKTEYDALSEELSEFTDDLQGKIDDIDENYTKLEQELQVRQERNVYQSNLASALVHDLKTPINISMLYVEQLQAKDSENPVLAKLAENDERLLNQVNNALQVINEDETASDQKEKTDIIPIVREILALFTPLFEEHKISISLDTPAEVYVQIRPIEFKQIIHNIISNASQYADDKGNFELCIDTKKDMLIIEAYNDKKDTSSIDFKRVFDLFYHVDTKDVKYGSGVGMYTIKNMVETYNGTCNFKPARNGVLLKIKMPIVIGA